MNTINNEKNFENSPEIINSLQSQNPVYPWILILISSAFLFYKFLLQISPSVMTSDLMRTFHINGAQLGNLASTYFYSYFIAQFLAGYLLDKYSLRHITSCAILISTIGGIIFASTNNLYVAGLARMLIGFGAAFATISYMKLSSIWFKPSQVGFVDGLLATSAMTGALFAQAPLAYLVTKQSWQNSLFDISLGGAFLALLYFMIVRNKNEPEIKKLSLLPQNSIKNESLINIIIKLLKKRDNVILTIYSGLAFTPVAVLGGLWANPFVVETYHLSITKAASLSSMIFLGLALGGPFFGFLADKFGHLKIMKLGTFLEFVCLTAIILIPNLPLPIFTTLLFLFGFATGSFMSCFALGKKYNNAIYTATIIALINTGDALFGSFTEPLIGKILDLRWNGTIANGIHHFTQFDYRIAFSILPGYLICGLIGLNFMTQKKILDK